MSDQTAPSTTNLRGTVISGIRWTSGGTAATYIIRLGQSIALARLLSPEDYGVVGIAAPALAMLNLLADMGFGAAIIQRQTDNILKYAYAAFWTLSGISLVLITIAAPFVPAFSEFFEEPRLQNVLYVMLAGLMVKTVGVVPGSLAQRDMKFRELSLVRLVAIVIGFVVAIGMALYGLGYWSLLFPTITTDVIVGLGCMYVVQWFPRFRYSWAAVKEIYGFSLTLFFARLLNFGAFNVRNLIIGKYLSTEVFGYFYFAVSRAQQPLAMVTGQYYGVSFAALSRLQNDLPRLRLKYYEMVKLTSFLLFPLAATMIFLADLIIPVVFGPQWVPAVFPFQMFSLLVVTSTFGSIPGILIRVLDKPQVALYGNLAKMIILVSGLLILLINGAGLTEISIFLPVAEVVVSVPIIVYMWYVLAARPGALWDAHAPGFLVSLGMGLFGVWLKSPISNVIPNQFLSLLVILAILGVFYVGASWLFNRSSLIAFLRFLERLGGGRRWLGGSKTG